jgi:hypothetical protein
MAKMIILKMEMEAQPPQKIQKYTVLQLMSLSNSLVRRSHTPAYAYAHETR